MAYLFKRGSIYYVKFYVAGKQKEKSLGTGVFQIAKEKQRQVRRSMLPRLQIADRVLYGRTPQAQAAIAPESFCERLR